jgi:hypothetical protein
VKFQTTSNSKHRYAGIVGLATVIAVATAMSLFGFPLWLQIIVCSIPWAIVLANRVGNAIAAPALVLIALLLILLTLMLTGTLHLNIVVSLSLMFAVAGLGGVALLLQTPALRLALPVDFLVRWLSPCVGAIVWFAAIGLAQFVPGASKLSWVASGDSANNILFAREIIDRGGIAIGSMENPVPLPAALLAVAMSASRGGLAASRLLEHDISAFAQVWALMIALTCILMGGAISAALPEARRLVIIGVSAASSFIPLTWYVSGYPIEYGFFNIHLALPVVLSCWIIFLGGNKHPIAALCLMFLAATILLSVWGPLVLFPSALAVAIFIRSLRAITTARGIALFALIVSALQAVLYGAFVTLPSLLSLAAFLGASGGAYPFSRWILPALLVVALGSALLLRRKSGKPILSGAIAIIAATCLGLAVLLFAARNTPNPFTSYYPLKFIWLAGIVLMVVVGGYAASIAVLFFTLRALQSSALVVVAIGTLVFVLLAPTNRTSYPTRAPIPKILSGGFLEKGDRTMGHIFRLSNPAHPGVLWHSATPYEGTIDFWLLQIKANSMTKNQALRELAYQLNFEKITDLCSIVTKYEMPVTVYTDDAGLATELDRACSRNSAKVVVGKVP